ncbi:MAG: DUF362 domain-containing protein [Methanomicrobiales archaeon]|nr:DUF362 domain-containing protein [Methanomicrobiales archaeon]
MAGTTTIFLSAARDRADTLDRLFSAVDLTGIGGRSVALKANYNSTDPFPASTHPDTLAALVRAIQAAGASTVTLAERSGMGDTRRVLEERGVLRLASDLGFHAVVLDESGRDGWTKVEEPGLHWEQGFWISREFMTAGCVVQTCCCKTHRFGGHFTLSLKNSVGLVARKVPGDAHDYMQELHTSPHQRKMIAEINRFYPVTLVVMDATTGFASGGPDRGRLVTPGVILAGTDRVAIDCAGIALLRSFGSTPEVMQGRIRDLEQIARAAELGVGTADPARIRLEPLDRTSEGIADEIREQMESGDPSYRVPLP